MGDKWPPWGVPEGTGDKLDEYPWTEVKWDLFVKYELSQDNRGSPKPNWFKAIASKL